MAEKCERSTEATMYNAAVRGEPKHHVTVVGHDRRRNTASTQHWCTKQSKTSLFMYLSVRIMHERPVIAIVTNHLRSFHISQESESIIQTWVWFFQVKICKDKQRHISCLRPVCVVYIWILNWSIVHHLHNMTRSCIYDPAEHTVVTVELWENYYNNRPTSWSHIQLD